MSPPKSRNRRKRMKRAKSLRNNSYGDFEKQLLQCQSAEETETDDEDDKPTHLNITIQIKTPINSSETSQLVSSFLEKVHLLNMSKSLTEDTTKVENFDDEISKTDTFVTKERDKSDDGIFVPRPIKVENFCEVFGENCKETKKEYKDSDRDILQDKSDKIFVPRPIKVENFSDVFHEIYKDDKSDQIFIPRPIKVEHFSDVFNECYNCDKSDDISVPKPIKVENIDEIFAKNYQEAREDFIHSYVDTINCQKPLSWLPNLKQNITSIGGKSDKNTNVQIYHNKSPTDSEKAKKVHILQNELLVTGNYNRRIDLREMDCELNDAIEDVNRAVDDMIQEEANFLVFTASDTASEVEVSDKKKRKRKRRGSNSIFMSTQEIVDAVVTDLPEDEFPAETGKNIIDFVNNKKKKGLKRTKVDSLAVKNQRSQIQIAGSTEFLPEDELSDNYEMLDLFTLEERCPETKKKSKKKGKNAKKTDSSVAKNQRSHIPVTDKTEFLPENELTDKDEVLDSLTQKYTSAESKKSRKKTKEDSSIAKNQRSGILSTEGLEILAVDESFDEDEMINLSTQKDITTDFKKKGKNAKKTDSSILKNQRSQIPATDATEFLPEVGLTDKDEALDSLTQKNTSGESKKNGKTTKEDTSIAKNQRSEILSTEKSEILAVDESFDEDEMINSLTQKDITTDFKKKGKNAKKTDSSIVKNQRSQIPATDATEFLPEVGLTDKDEALDSLTQKDTSGESKKNGKKTKEDSSIAKNQRSGILSTEESEILAVDESFDEDEMINSSTQKDITTDSKKKGKNAKKTDSSIVKNRRSQIPATDATEFLPEVGLTDTDEALDLLTLKDATAESKKNRKKTKEDFSIAKNQRSGILSTEESEILAIDESFDEDEMINSLTQKDITTDFKKKGKNAKKTDSSIVKNQRSQIPATDATEFLPEVGLTDKDEALDLLTQKDTSAELKKNRKTTKEDSSITKNQRSGILSTEESEILAVDESFDEDEMINSLTQKDTTTDSKKKGKNAKKTDSSIVKNQRSQIPATDATEFLPEVGLTDKDEALDSLTQKNTSAESKKNRKKTKEDSSIAKNQRSGILSTEESEILAVDESFDKDELINLLTQKDASTDSKKSDKRTDSSIVKNQRSQIPATDATEFLPEVGLTDKDEALDSLTQKDTSAESKKNRKKTKEDSSIAKNQRSGILSTEESEILAVDESFDEDEMINLLAQKDINSKKRLKKPNKTDSSILTRSQIPTTDKMEILPEVELTDKGEVLDLLTQKDTSEESKKNGKNTEGDSSIAKNQRSGILSSEESEILAVDESFDKDELINSLTQKDTSTDSKKNGKRTDSSIVKNQRSQILSTDATEFLPDVGLADKDEALTLKDTSVGSTKNEKGTKEDSSIAKNRSSELLSTGESEILDASSEKRQREEISTAGIDLSNTQELIDDIVMKIRLSKKKTTTDEKDAVESPVVNVTPVVEENPSENESVGSSINIARLVALNEGNAKAKTTTPIPKPARKRAKRSPTKKRDDKLRQTTIDEIIKIPDSIFLNKDFFYGGNKIETSTNRIKTAKTKKIKTSIIEKTNVETSTVETPSVERSEVETPSVEKPTNKLTRPNGKRKIDTTSVDIDLSKIANDKAIDTFLDSLGLADHPSDEVLIKPPDKFKKIRRTPAKGRRVDVPNHLEETESYLSDATSTLSISDLLLNDVSEIAFSQTPRKGSPKTDGSSPTVPSSNITPISKNRKRKIGTMEHIVRTPPRLRLDSEISSYDYVIETPRRDVPSCKESTDLVKPYDALKSQSEVFGDVTLIDVNISSGDTLKIATGESYIDKTIDGQTISKKFDENPKSDNSQSKIVADTARLLKMRDDRETLTGELDSEEFLEEATNDKNIKSNDLKSKTDTKRPGDDSRSDLGNTLTKRAGVRRGEIISDKNPKSDDSKSKIVTDRTRPVKIRDDQTQELDSEESIEQAISDKNPKSNDLKSKSGTKRSGDDSASDLSDTLTKKAGVRREEIISDKNPKSDDSKSNIVPDRTRPVNIRDNQTQELDFEESLEQAISDKNPKSKDLKSKSGSKRVGDDSASGLSNFLTKKSDVRREAIISDKNPKSDNSKSKIVANRTRLVKRSDDRETLTRELDLEEYLEEAISDKNPKSNDLKSKSGSKRVGDDSASGLSNFLTKKADVSREAIISDKNPKSDNSKLKIAADRTRLVKTSDDRGILTQELDSNEFPEGAISDKNPKSKNLKSKTGTKRVGDDSASGLNNFLTKKSDVCREAIISDKNPKSDNSKSKIVATRTRLVKTSDDSETLTRELDLEEIVEKAISDKNPKSKDLKSKSGVKRVGDDSASGLSNFFTKKTDVSREAIISDKNPKSDNSKSKIVANRTRLVKTSDDSETLTRELDLEEIVEKAISDKNPKSNDLKSKSGSKRVGDDSASGLSNFLTKKADVSREAIISDKNPKSGNSKSKIVANRTRLVKRSDDSETLTRELDLEEIVEKAISDKNPKSNDLKSKSGTKRVGDDSASGLSNFLTKKANVSREAIISDTNPKSDNSKSKIVATRTRLMKTSDDSETLTRELDLEEIVEKAISDKNPKSKDLKSKSGVKRVGDDSASGLSNFLTKKADVRRETIISDKNPKSDNSKSKIAADRTRLVKTSDDRGILTQELDSNEFPEGAISDKNPKSKNLKSKSGVKRVGDDSASGLSNFLTKKADVRRETIISDTNPKSGNSKSKLVADRTRLVKIRDDQTQKLDSEKSIDEAISDKNPKSKDLKSKSGTKRAGDDSTSGLNNFLTKKADVCRETILSDKNPKYYNSKSKIAADRTRLVKTSDDSETLTRELDLEEIVEKAISDKNPKSKDLKSKSGAKRVGDDLASGLSNFLTKKADVSREAIISDKNPKSDNSNSKIVADRTRPVNIRDDQTQELQSEESLEQAISDKNPKSSDFKSKTGTKRPVDDSTSGLNNFLTKKADIRREAIISGKNPKSDDSKSKIAHNRTSPSKMRDDRETLTQQQDLRLGTDFEDSLEESASDENPNSDVSWSESDTNSDATSLKEEYDSADSLNNRRILTRRVTISDRITKSSDSTDDRIGRTSLKSESDSSTGVITRGRFKKRAESDNSFSDASFKMETNSSNDRNYYESALSDGDGTVDVKHKRRRADSLTIARAKRPRVSRRNISKNSLGKELSSELVYNFFSKNALLGCNKREAEASTDDDGERDTDGDELSDGADELSETFTEVVANARAKLASVAKVHKKLSELYIELDWDVPVTHMIETRLSKPCTKEQRAQFEALGLKLRTGPFLRKEDRLIKENFRRFCAQYDIDEDPEPFLRNTYDDGELLSRRERRKFMQYLSRGLDNRKLVSVYERFCNIMDNKKKGFFSAEEDAVLLMYCKNFPDDPNKFWTLSLIMNRSRRALLYRLSRLQKQFGQAEKTSTVKYRRFIRRLMRVTGVDSVLELKTHEITVEEWLALSVLYNGLGWYHLRKFWLEWVYPRLYSTGPINRDEILRRLVKEFYDARVKDARDIDWGELSMGFENCPPQFLRTQFHQYVVANVPKRLQHRFRSVVKYLHARIGSKTLDVFIYPIDYV